MATRTPFAGRVAIVTGGASGIGWALCRALAHRGARIALLDLDADAAEQCAIALHQEGAECLAVSCDVADETACSAAVGQAIDHFGGVDILVNNAGITQLHPLAETEASVYHRVMGVNFFGALYATRAALPALIQRRGIIVVTSSIAGMVPLSGRTGYCASKHALHGLFDTLRVELRPHGVQVLIVCPGFVDTNLKARALGRSAAVTDRPRSTVGRIDSPEHVAGRICGAIEKRQRLMVLSGVGQLARWLHIFCPGFYDWLMARKLQVGATEDRAAET